jgi:7,8-dihydropterin-6-yl-methyl-4-(beta-D-ribofuranosyl)aminobenzene 5'-phosphate synthase
MRKLLPLLFTALLAAPPSGPLEIRILYDNTSAQKDMQADWGFAALITFGGHRVLFDTGAKADLFMENLKKAGVDPASIEHVVISHAHADHTAGLEQLSTRNPRIIVHQPDKPGAFQIVPGVYSTGIIEGPVSEQALVIETSKGLVVLTGCAHPGVVRMVEAAEKQRGKDSVRLLLGGFHMLQQSAAQIHSTIARFKQLRVASVVPAHCSGDLSIKLLRQAFPSGSDGAGAGKRILLD